MATRVHVQTVGHESDDEGSGISAATGFVSQSDSDASAEPEDPPQGRYNKATYGISPGELLREECIVAAVLSSM